MENLPVPYTKGKSTWMHTMTWWLFMINFSTIIKSWTSQVSHTQVMDFFRISEVGIRLLTVNQLVRVIDRYGGNRTLPRSKNLKTSSLKELLRLYAE
jgi:hypothetical protein